MAPSLKDTAGWQRISGTAKVANCSTCTFQFEPILDETLFENRAVLILLELCREASLAVKKF